MLRARRRRSGRRVDPDGEVSVVRLLLEDHDVLARGQVYPDAVDLDLDQIFRISLLSPEAGYLSTCVD
jgi:hypothetical protein